MIRTGCFLLAGVFAPSACLAVPPQIVPEVGELGTPSFSFPGSATGQGASSAASTSSYSGAWGTGNAYSTMLSQSYGAAAVAAAQAQGINPDTLAAFGQIESHFSNVGNASSSASGVWQVTDGTWNDYASKLGLSGADRSDPAVQAKVASAIIDDYASAISKTTGAAATGTQVYGAYMFGTRAGSEIAAAKDSQTPPEPICLEQRARCEPYEQLDRRAVLQHRRAAHGLRRLGDRDQWLSGCRCIPGRSMRLRAAPSLLDRPTGLRVFMPGRRIASHYAITGTQKSRAPGTMGLVRFPDMGGRAVVAPPILQGQCLPH